MTPSRFIYPSPGFHHYWTKGYGKEMLRKLPRVPDKIQIEKKIPLLFESDSLADEIIREVHLQIGFKDAQKLFENIFINGIEKTDHVPVCVQKLFSEVNSVPDWVNWNKLEKGAVFCRRSSAFGMVVLRNYCLMGGYESAAINKPLIFTEALKKGAAKRMAETIEFWVNVTGENALQKNEIGFKHAIRVRLMHAFARVSILKHPDWKNGEWGVPINHWDMVATNLGFSLAFMDGLRHLGFRPTKEEAEGLLHFWKYIGFLLGIPPQYLPDTESQAIEELYCWTITQPPADKDTIALAHALMNEPIKSSYPKKIWQRKVMIKIHLAYNLFFLGNRSCKTMNLPYTDLKYYPYLVKWINSVHEVVVLTSRSFHSSAERRGRKSQVSIKNGFLRGYEEMKNQLPNSG